MKNTDITEFELAKQYGPKIAVVEVHWQVGEHFQYNTGVLSPSHSASSYGQPVFIAGSNSHVVPERQLVPGQVYGPADLPAGYKMLWIAGHRLACNEANNWDIEKEAAIIRSGKAAGYKIEAAGELDV
ncbi:MAG: hypothetical protein WC405_18645 [Syntrophales bacterium]